MAVAFNDADAGRTQPAQSFTACHIGPRPHPASAKNPKPDGFVTIAMGVSARGLVVSVQGSSAPGHHLSSVF